MSLRFVLHSIVDCISPSRRLRFELVFRFPKKNQFQQKNERHRSFDDVHFRDLKSAVAHFQQLIDVEILLTIMKAILYTLIATLSVQFISIDAQPKKPYYWVTRKLTCNSISGHNVSRCSLHLPNVKPEQNPDCHEDLDKHNRTKVYCRIMCEESDDTTVLAKIPTWNHACNIFYTYQLERLRKDWYLWRSGECLNTTITFDLRCGFARDSHIFYRENAKLFEYDDAPDKGKHYVNRFRPR